MWLECSYAASVVVSLTYGKRVESVDEWIVKEMSDSMDCKLLLALSSHLLFLPSLIYFLVLQT